MHIIFATDSRGANIQHFVEENSNLIKNKHVFHFVIVRGGKVERIVSNVENYINSKKIYKPKMIMFAGGICDLTQKITHSTGTEIIYTPRENIVESITTQLGHFQTRFKAQYNIQVKIACIPPVSLLKSDTFAQERNRLQHSIYTTHQKQQQQKQLEHDIRLINTNIMHMNTTSFLRTVRWDRDITKTKTQLRGRHNQNKHKVSFFCYKHMYDGVHPDNYLFSKWYRYMCLSISKDIFHSLYITGTPSSPTQHENWDFKRQARH